MAEQDDVLYGAIHSSATPPSMNVTEEMIRGWHKDRGFDDIGYHIFIKRSGHTDYGRPFDVRGAHVKGHNANSIGICLEGGVSEDGDPEDNFTDEQKHTLLRVMDGLRMLFPGLVFKGHRDFSGTDTSCPSFDVGVFLNVNARGHYYG